MVAISIRKAIAASRVFMEADDELELKNDFLTAS